MKFCNSCGAKLEHDGKVGREKICSNCGAYLHSCLNCEFYDEFAHNRCREPDAEWVSDKETGNFCEFFRFRELAQPPEEADRKRRAKEDLKGLFG